VAGDRKFLQLKRGPDRERNPDDVLRAMSGLEIKSGTAPESAGAD
jgi:hypothetical protein